MRPETVKLQMGRESGNPGPSSAVADSTPGSNRTASAPAATSVHVNQVGYETRAPKRAVVESDEALISFRIVREDGSATLALEGELIATPAPEGWTARSYVYTADFSALQEPGEYKLWAGGGCSAPFRVADELLFGATGPEVLRYFKRMRADAPEVWRADAAIPVLGSTETRDVRGGWYDASGDISKYLSHLSFANFMNPQQTPLLVWILAWARDEAAALLSRYGLLQAAADEAAWGADFLVRMQAEEGFFFATVYDGWTWDLKARKLCAYSGAKGVLNENYHAAFREGGGMAIAALARAARGGSGAYPTNAYFDAAVRGFAHLSEHNLAYVDDGVENIIDDYAALLAATELYKSTAEHRFLSAARARATRLVSRLHPEGYFIADSHVRPFYHASDAGLPVLALLEYTSIELESERRDMAFATVARHLNYLITLTDAAPNPFGYARQHTAPARVAFFMPHANESGYWWQGENARLASLSAAAWLARRAFVAGQASQGGAAATMASGSLPAPSAVHRFATDQLDWVLGKNPADVCMLDGFGVRNPEPYNQNKPYAGTLRGGIANGITSREEDELGFQWSKPALTPGSEVERWRWLEQWLPHAAWYFMAVILAASDSEVERARSPAGSHDGVKTP